MTSELTALAALHLVLAAGCAVAAARWPGPGRAAATAVTGLLAAAAIPLSAPAFAYGADPAQADTIGASAATLVGGMVVLVGVGLAALAAVIQRGNDSWRALVATVLGLLGGLSILITWGQITTEDGSAAPPYVPIVLAGLGAIAGAALLVGGAVAPERRR